MNVMFTAHDDWTSLNWALEDEGLIKLFYNSILSISMDNTNVSGWDELVVTHFIVWGQTLN